MEKPKVAPYKKKVVEDFAKMFEEYPIVGALNMENMPGAQLGVMRKKLRSQAKIVMTKKRLLHLAIEKVKGKKKGIEELEKNFKGMPAIMFTKENPFTIFKSIKKSKSKAAAKAGQIAPYDLEVKAGPTSFAPGPIIGELGALGIVAGVEDGKIAIKKDSVIVKEGEEITEAVANMLVKLGIEPMEIGLDLVAVYEDGIIYKKDVLDVDEDEFKAKLSTAAQWGINLAVEAGYPTTETLAILIPKAHRAAHILALDNAIPASGVTEELLEKGERQAQSLKSAGNIETGASAAPAEEKKEEKAEEKPAEEAKPEEKKEEAPAEEPKAEDKKEETPAQAPAEEKKE